MLPSNIDTLRLSHMLDVFNIRYSPFIITTEEQLLLGRTTQLGATALRRPALGETLERATLTWREGAKHS